MLINIFGDFVAEDVSTISFSNSLKEAIKTADYNIINFEAPIRTEYEVPAPKSGPSISQDPFSPQWLIENGVNVFCLANNHIFDYGENGYKATRYAIKNAYQVGAGTLEEAFSPVILKKEDLRVAIFSLAELQFGVFYDEEPGTEKLAAGWINHPIVEKKIKEAKCKYDYVILIAHAGLECEDIPLPEWRQRYRQLIDVGCDVIVGGHTHCSQGYEIYNGKLIFYSVGNFCFSKQIEDNEDWNIGEMLTFEITLKGIEFQCSGTKYDNGRLILIDKNVWANKLAERNQKLQHPLYTIQVNDMCKRHLQDYYMLCAWSGYVHPYCFSFRNLMLLLLNKYFHIRRGFSSLHMLNNLQCETHRWCFMRGLKV